MRHRHAQDAALLALVGEVEQELASSDFPPPPPPALSILIPVTLRRGDVAVDVFTAITTVGTPLDITLQELRIETFFPANAPSRLALERVVQHSAAD